MEGEKFLPLQKEVRRDLLLTLPHNCQKTFIILSFLLLIVCGYDAHTFDDVGMRYV